MTGRQVGAPATAMARAPTLPPTPRPQTPVTVRSAVRYRRPMPVTGAGWRLPEERGVSQALPRGSADSGAIPRRPVRMAAPRRGVLKPQAKNVEKP